MQGAGNDYIYVDTQLYDIPNPEKAAIAWSAYHTGIGSDGLVLIGKPHNYTRFLVVCNPQKAALLRPIEKANKASIVFSLPHDKGSLSKVLTILSFYDINLTKIQSLPNIGHEWEYLFYVDLTFDNLTRYRQSIDAITPLVKKIKVLGEYEEKE